MKNIDLDDPNISMINIVFGLRDDIPVVLSVDAEGRIIDNSDMLDLLFSQVLLGSLSAGNKKEREERILRHCAILMAFLKGGDKAVSKKFDEYFEGKNPMK